MDEITKDSDLREVTRKRKEFKQQKPGELHECYCGVCPSSNNSKRKLSSGQRLRWERMFDKTL